MISNSNPWDNLKFDIDGVNEISRKFFGTLLILTHSLLFTQTLMNLMSTRKILQ